MILTENDERVIALFLGLISVVVSLCSLGATIFFSRRVHNLSKVAIDQNQQANEIALWALPSNTRDEMKRATEVKEINNEDQNLVSNIQEKEENYIPKELKKHLLINKISKFFKRKN